MFCFVFWGGGGGFTSQVSIYFHYIESWHLAVFFSVFCFPFIHAVLVPIFRRDRFHCVSIQLSLGLFLQLRSWEYQSVRKRELESTRVSKQGYFFCCGRTFFPVRFFFFFRFFSFSSFFLVRSLMQRTQDCECVWKRDREEVHCYPFSLCTVELSMIHWWSFQCGAITELLPISTPPSSPPDCGSEACWETAGLFMWVAVPRGQLCEI